MNTSRDELISTITSKLGKYLTDFHLGIHEVTGESAPLWKISFSYHCTASGTDVSISDAIDVGDTGAIFNWIVSSLYEEASKVNIGGKLDSYIRDIVEKGESMGWVSPEHAGR
ncbi:MAG: hypothetical protein ABI430_01100 [Candidatus Taylorbacteria bacterium]